MAQCFKVIDEDCIGCRLCSERAPENLEIPDGTSIAQLFKQPETPEEEQACLDASAYCPMGALQVDENAGSFPSAATSEGGRSAFLPAGDSTPADTSTRLEN